MRLVRWVVVLYLLGVVGWFAVRAVTVESTGQTVRITVDKQKLKEAGHELAERGRTAVGKVSRAFDTSGGEIQR